jgi:hypothetical protein
MRRRVLELVGAVLLVWFPLFSYAARVPNSLPLLGTRIRFAVESRPVGSRPGCDLADQVVAIPEFLCWAMHERGVPAMNIRLLLQSVFFVAEGLMLVLLLSAALHFEAARLLFGIVAAAFCLIVEIFVAVRVAQRLWKWSGQLTGLMIRANSGRAISAAAGNRGDA